MKEYLSQILEKAALSELDKVVHFQEIIKSAEDQIFFKNWLSETDGNGLYPTSIAASRGQLALLETFLVTIKDEKEIYQRLFLNAIQIAVICGKVTVLAFLYNIKPEFDLYVPFFSGNSGNAIQTAAIHGQLFSVQFLLDTHPDGISLVNVAKERIIDLACKSGNLELVNFLLEKYNIELNTCNEAGIYLIHYAVNSGNLDLVQWLLEQGVNPKLKTKDKFQQNPAHIAAIYGFVNIFVELQKYTDNIHSCNGIGLTPLHLAIIGNHKSMVAWLLENGANSNQKTQDDYRNTVFHIAAFYGCYELLDLLLNYSEQSKVNFVTPNAFGYFPLHCVVVNLSAFEKEYYNVNLRRKLQKVIPTKYQKIHYFYKKILQHIPIPLYSIYEFMEISKSISTAGYPSIIFEKNSKPKKNDYDHKKVIEWLLDHKVDINQTTLDEMAYTPSHLAAVFGQIEHLELLKNKGADINKVGESGCSPIYLAVKFNQHILAIINNNHTKLKFFVENELPIDEEIKKIKPTWAGMFNEIPVPDHGWAPIHYLSMITIENYPMGLTTITTLLESKINVNAVACEGKTIFHLLMENLAFHNDKENINNYFLIISMLLVHGLDVHYKTNYRLQWLSTETIIETGYDAILRNAITNSKYINIASSLLQIFKEHGVHINALSYLGFYVANFYRSTIKKQFLNLILQYFPEIYSGILERCSESLKLVISTPPPGLWLPPGSTAYAAAKIQLIRYGFLIGRDLTPKQIDILQNFFKNSSEAEHYLAIGVKFSEGTLPKNPLINSETVTINEITPADKLLFLRILGALLITPMSSFAKITIQEIKKVFCKLARAALNKDTLAIISQILDKIALNPSDKLDEQDIHDLKKLYMEIYKSVNGEIPSLQHQCEDFIIRCSSFAIQETKENFNQELLFFGKSLKRIRENREIILNKINFLGKVNTTIGDDAQENEIKNFLFKKE